MVICRRSKADFDRRAAISSPLFSPGDVDRSSGSASPIHSVCSQSPTHFGLGSKNKYGRFSAWYSGWNHNIRRRLLPRPSISVLGPQETTTYDLPGWSNLTSSVVIKVLGLLNPDPFCGCVRVPNINGNNIRYRQHHLHHFLHLLNRPPLSSALPVHVATKCFPCISNPLCYPNCAMSVAG